MKVFKSTGGVITLNKVADDEERWVVPGYYTNDKVDLHGHMIDREAMTNALPDYREWGTVREMHEHPIGTAKIIGIPEWNYLEAEIGRSSRGQEVWNLVKSGVYKAFSVGIIVTDGYFVPVQEIEEEKWVGIGDSMRSLFNDVGYIFKITGLTLVENSIVDRPANPGARMKELGVSLGAEGLLPKIDGTDGIEAIKSLIVPKSYVINPGKLEAKSADESADQAVSDINASIENEKVEEKQVEELNKEVDQEVTPEVETEEVMEAPADETAEKELSDGETATESHDEILTSIKGIEASLEAFAKGISDNLNGEIAKLHATMEEIKSLLSTAQEEAEKSVDAEAVEETAVEDNSDGDEVPETTSKSPEIDLDELADSIYNKLAEKILPRKGVVSVEDEAPPEDEVVAIKSLDRRSLKDKMGRMAANIR